MGKGQRVSLVGRLADNKAALEALVRAAAGVGLECGPPDEGGEKPHLSTRHAVLSVVVATLMSHTRRDEMYCVLAVEGWQPVRVPASKAISFLRAGRWGLLTLSTQAPTIDGKRHGKSCRRCDALSGSCVTWARQLATQRLMRLDARSAALVAEELAQIDAFYRELAAEALAPLRRLNLRISSIGERRGQSRTTKAYDAAVTELRRLKSRFGGEEKRLADNRRALEAERAAHIAEATNRYKSTGRLKLVQEARMLVEVPTLRLTSGLDLSVHPFLESTPLLVWPGGQVQARRPDALYTVCPSGHPVEVSEASRCACGGLVCDYCVSSCPLCGYPVCPACVSEGACPSCAELEATMPSQ